MYISRKIESIEAFKHEEQHCAPILSAWLGTNKKAISVEGENYGNQPIVVSAAEFRDCVFDEDTYTINGVKQITYKFIFSGCEFYNCKFTGDTSMKFIGCTFHNCSIVKSPGYRNFSVQLYHCNILESDISAVSATTIHGILMDIIVYYTEFIDSSINITGSVNYANFVDCDLGESGIKYNGEIIKDINMLCQLIEGTSQKKMKVNFQNYE